MQQLSAQPWMTAASQKVLRAIAEAGGEARYVGGCVRDAVLGRSGGDVDMACNLPPERMMEALQTANIRAIPTGIDHGTVTAICESHLYEITTLRQDIDCDGRHAEVVFTDDWQADAARRDFTMNALYASADGTVYDYFNGVADAQQGLVRFIGDAHLRIREDGLRILRFFRFFAHFGHWPMDEAALSACAAHKDMLHGLSGERIQAEMLKLLHAPKVADVLEIMQQQGVLAAIGMPHANVSLLEQLSADITDPILRLATLLRHPQESPLENVLQRWKLSNADKARLRKLVPMEIRAVIKENEWQQKKRLRKQGKRLFCDIAQLAIAERPKALSALTKQLFLAQSWQPPRFPLTGQDLLAIGIPQGKILGELLKQLEAEWEDSHYVPDKHALLKRAQQLQH
jgi:poly(A) polymerase